MPIYLSPKTPPLHRELDLARVVSSLLGIEPDLRLDRGDIPIQISLHGAHFKFSK